MRRAAARKVGSPDPGTSGPAVPMTRTGRAAAGAGSSSGTAKPGGTTAMQRLGDAEVLRQVVGQLAADGDEPAAPRPAQAQPRAPRGRNSSIVST